MNHRTHRSISKVAGPRATTCLWLGALAMTLTAAVGCGEPNATVTIDNSGEAALVVEVNDLPKAMIEPGTFQTLSFPPGEYKFKLQSAGETLFDGMKTLEPSEVFGFGREYIWNPGGENRYAVCKVMYGSMIFGNAAEDAILKFAEQHTGQKADPARVEFFKIKRYAEPMPSTTWFEMPRGVMYTLKNPPESVYTRSGSTSRRALTRISKEDHRQLQTVYSIENPTESDVEILAEVAERALNSLEFLQPTGGTTL